MFEFIRKLIVVLKTFKSIQSILDYLQIVFHIKPFILSLKKKKREEKKNRHDNVLIHQLGPFQRTYK